MLGVGVDDDECSCCYLRTWSMGTWELSPYGDEFHSEVKHVIGTCHTPRVTQMNAKVDFWPSLLMFPPRPFLYFAL